MMEDELTHHGVKGQKWGVRKQRKPYTKTDGKKRIRNGKYTSSDGKNIRSISRNRIRKTGSRAVETGKKFIEQNGKTIAVTALSVAAITTGHAYLTPIITAGSTITINTNKNVK